MADLTPLALKYRPMLFSDTIGQEFAVNVLKKSILEGKTYPSLVFFGHYGSGKCVMPGTRVCTSMGYVPIETLVSNPVAGFSPCRVSVMSRQGVKLTSHFFYEKGSKVIRYRLSTGRWINGTPEHRVLALRDGRSELVRMDELGVGSEVVLSNVPMKFGKDTECSEITEYWLGAFLGDGYSSGGNLGFCGTHEFTSACKGAFHLDGVLTKDKRCEDLFVIRETTDSRMPATFDAYRGKNSHTKVVPEWVFKAGFRTRWSFLRGVIDTDGSVSKNSVDVTLASEVAIKGLQELLETLGVVSMVGTKVVGGVNYYRLRVRGEQFLGLELPRVYGRKNLPVVLGNGNARGVFPITEAQANKLRDIRLASEHVKRDRGEFIIQNAKWCGKTSKRSMGLFKETYGELPEELAFMLDSTLAVIVDREECVSDVYDVTVPESHEFLAQGLFNHNTTLARLYAKALNCENIKDGEPCCVCEHCKAIVSGRSMVYLEQDAASCGNVEHARKIGELISYKPLGKYRVICIDEAHAATNAAWNAMLKYVEEPPPNVVFIFVTTEVEKIPNTILSRCFAIPFRGVSNFEVTARLQSIAKAEGIKVESPEIYQSIVRRTGGAVRDALVMLDQARMAAGSGVVTMKTLEPLGFCDPSIFIEFMSLWKAQDSNGMIAMFRKWAPLIGPEAFLSGLEDVLNREILTAVGVEQGRSERRAMLRLTMAELWSCIRRVWSVIDSASLDLGRVETTLICTLMGLGEEKPLMSNQASTPVKEVATETQYKEPAPVEKADPVDPEQPAVCSSEEMEKLLNE